MDIEADCELQQVTQSVKRSSGTLLTHLIRLLLHRRVRP